MSALNPDEPAQETPSSIDTQHLQQQLQQQQQHNQQEILVQQPIQPPSQSSIETGRKGPYTASPSCFLSADLPGTHRF
jgi:polysaccharide deacetylase 2 family uncharacterized protein YibQ